ncbi:MAG: hypothetical protein HY909_10495 [Deltaproteobacteria bacterium]|nr:hypothetical protein [Deltaproteobacteria bacterium]
MAAGHTTWTVLPHGPLEALAENLWRVTGSLPGMAMKRVMTVARYADGGLLVHNAIALDEAGMKALEALGPVRALVVPSGYHRLDAGTFKARYPEARVYCPRGVTGDVAKVVAVDGAYEDAPRDDTMWLERLEGVGDREGALQVRSRDGATVVLNDLVFNMAHGAGLYGFVLRYVTASTGGPWVSRVGRWFLVKDREAVRRELLRLSQVEGLRRVLVAHEDVIAEDPSGALRAVAATL